MKGSGSSEGKYWHLRSLLEEKPLEKGEKREKEAIRQLLSKNKNSS